MLNLSLLNNNLNRNIYINTIGQISIKYNNHSVFYTKR